MVYLHFLLFTKTLFMLPNETMIIIPSQRISLSICGLTVPPCGQFLSCSAILFSVHSVLHHCFEELSRLSDWLVELLALAVHLQQKLNMAPLCLFLLNTSSYPSSYGQSFYLVKWRRSSTASCLASRLWSRLSCLPVDPPQEALCESQGS